MHWRTTLLCLIAFGLPASVSGDETAKAAPDLRGFASPDLSITAVDIDGNNVVRHLGTWDGMPDIGLHGGRKFLLQIENQSQLHPVRVVLAIADGTLVELDPLKPEIEFSCPCLFPYYGLVMAGYPNGHVAMLAFKMHAAWKLEEVAQIQRPAPELARPHSAEEPLDLLLQDWWMNVVEPIETIRKG